MTTDKLAKMSGRRKYNPQWRVFVCSICGEKVAAPKKRRYQTAVGHIKHMYCFRCQYTTEHIQIE
jgi:hypothetical protein